MHIPKLGEASPIEIAARVILDLSRGADRPSWDDDMGKVSLGSKDLMARAEQEVGQSVVWDPRAGGLHVFRDGWWRRYDVTELARLVGRYDEMDYGTTQKGGGLPQLRMTSMIHGSVMAFVEMYTTRPGWFEDAPGAFATPSNTYIPADVGGPFAPAPDIRCRYGSDLEPEDEWTEALIASIRRVIRPRKPDKATEDAYLQILMEWYGLTLVGAAPKFARGIILKGTDGPAGGGGNNGKSSLMDTLRAGLAPELVYAREGDIELKEYMKGRLRGKYLFTVSEADTGRVDIKALNGIVAGGLDEGRNVGESGEAFRYRCGVIVDCNKLPRLKGGDVGGCRRRWAIIPCENDMRASGYSADDMAYIRQHGLPGLQRMALAAAQEAYARRALTPLPEDSAARLKLWLQDARPVDIWMSTWSVSDGAFMEADRLWGAYRSWLDDGNYKCTLTRREWGGYVAGNIPEGIIRGRHPKNRREGYRNLVLSEDSTPSGDIMQFPQIETKT